MSTLVPPSAERLAPNACISMREIRKRFGAVHANRGALLEVASGEIHALVGENGAGKSTLMRILAGLYEPDSGTVEVDGRDVTGWSVLDAIRTGVGMVHQHFMLVPSLTVAENVVLGREPRRGVAIDMARAILEVQGIGEQFGFMTDPRRRVSDLSVGEAQRVEIIKALFRGARILILDEPTAVLSPPEVQGLWRTLRRFRDGGGTIVLITHKLDEVMEISDRITVMRQGETVARMRTSDTSPAAVARAMVGRESGLGARRSTLGDPEPASEPGGGNRQLEEDDADLGSSAPHSTSRRPTAEPRAPSAEPRAPSAESAPALSVHDLVVPGAAGPRAVDGVTLSLAAGEILGIAGVEGNGQAELVEAIAGLRQATSGTILLDSRDVTALGVRERSKAGLAHIPEDRHRRGLVLDYSVADNLILGDQDRFTRGATLDRLRIAANAAVRIERFDIRPPDPELPARALSGGNQQKVVVAREMGGDFSALLAAHPTRGVDVGAVESIHAQLRAARAAGKATLLVSAELTEILALADRIAVMYRGRVVGILQRTEASAAALGPLMTGAHTSAA